MKHIAIDLHFVRDYVSKGLLNVAHVSTHDQLADLMTKALSRQQFQLLRSKIVVADGSTILRGPRHRGVDWATIMVSFCLASATAIALMSIQVQSRELPTAIHVFSLAIVLAVPSFFVSELISSKLEVAGHVLKRLGMFLTATAFFVAITIPFPSYFKIISWFLYAISFLVILVCHCL
ncbi:hypothetical protein I3760_11G092600 [Carya illinoinensis]|nr:hypothetical protein I3760_11G092600 [Carya illinoinensis]